MINYGDTDYQSSELRAAVTNTDVTKEHWFKSRWRPAMAWLYLCICAFDFIIAPVLNAVEAQATHQPLVQWVPLTLQGGGLLHLSMGAIVGVYAYARTLEKKMILQSDGGSGTTVNVNPTPTYVRKYPSVSSPAQTSNTAPASTPGLDPNAPSSGNSSRFDP